MRLRFARLALTALFLAAGLAAPAHAVPVFFVVAESGAPVHGDSYVLRLDAPDDISHARDLIAQGPAAGAPIVVAAIAPGADGINRDVLAPGEPLWSWHITSFEGFADSTIEILDGWPTFVEEDVAGWIANTGGFIGFWNYTVVAELPSTPEPGGVLLLAGGFGALAGLRLRRARG